jgi:hypothetical protein
LASTPESLSLKLSKFVTCSLFFEIAPKFGKNSDLNFCLRMYINNQSG